MYWKTVAEHTPSSAKVMPVWVNADGKVDLVYLTDDEKYFVSTDHKRVYLAENVVWEIVDVPSPITSPKRFFRCRLCDRKIYF